MIVKLDCSKLVMRHRRGTFKFQSVEDFVDEIFNIQNDYPKAEFRFVEMRLRKVTVIEKIN